MTTRKPIFFSALLLMLFAACKKETTFTYKANCNQCKISYFDETGNFVSREEHQGAFEKEISVPSFSPVVISLQSTVTDSATLATEVITVSVEKAGKTVCADTSANGKKFHSITCSYDW